MSNMQKTTGRKATRKKANVQIAASDLFSQETSIRTVAPKAISGASVPRSLAMIEGPLAEFLRARGLLNNQLKFRPMAEFMLEFRNNHSAGALSDHRTIAIARSKDQVYFSVSSQPQKLQLH